MSDLLFAYGTLLPGDVRWHVLEPFVLDDGTPDRTAGHLYDTGEGYPAARFDAEGAAAHIEGRVFRLRPERLDDALRVLDEVEGAVAGDYRRVRVTTHAGHHAWAYAYGGGLQLEPIGDGSWVAHLARRAG